ncbi:hypothetical protein B0H10DRAFT_1958704 [Mycena sp. CBHHK59/15]|nr:hypothetical protein B0H10DRAFT_1958704 [Mycena sp. CBHHK59/15]
MAGTGAAEGGAVESDPVLNAGGPGLAIAAGESVLWLAGAGILGHREGGGSWGTATATTPKYKGTTYDKNIVVRQIGCVVVHGIHPIPVSNKFSDQQDSRLFSMISNQSQSITNLVNKKIRTVSITRCPCRSEMNLNIVDVPDVKFAPAAEMKCHKNAIQKPHRCLECMPTCRQVCIWHREHVEYPNLEMKFLAVTLAGFRDSKDSEAEKCSKTMHAELGEKSTRFSAGVPRMIALTRWLRMAGGGGYSDGLSQKLMRTISVADPHFLNDIFVIQHYG